MSDKERALFEAWWTGLYNEPFSEMQSLCDWECWKAARAALDAPEATPRTDPSQPWTKEHLHSYPEEALAWLNQKVAEQTPSVQELSDEAIDAWAISQQFVLFCDPEDVRDIVRSALQKWAAKAQGGSHG